MMHVITNEELSIMLRRAWHEGMKHGMKYGIGNNGVSYPCPTAEEMMEVIRQRRLDKVER